MNCNNRMIRIAPIPQGAKLICGERFRKVSTVGSMATAERNRPMTQSGPFGTLRAFSDPL